MLIKPFILGSGRSGQAMAQSLAILNLVNPDFNLDAPTWLSRTADFTDEKATFKNSILCICNPHGLHAETLLKAELAGFDALICEKPAAVNLEQIESLREIKTPTALLHVYRQMWGPQHLKQMIDQNEFGEIIAIEGRYWQGSTAARAFEKPADADPTTLKSWKNDTGLSGMHDVFLDIGTHWVDAASFLFGSPPLAMEGWRSYVNAEAPHRDSHVQLQINYVNGKRASASISKMIHGSNNHFEINILGAKMTATWNFLNPDEILIGQGRERKVRFRRDSSTGSRNPPFHGTGWLEGYIDIASEILSEVYLKRPANYPRLQDNLNVLASMLKTNWKE